MSKEKVFNWNLLQLWVETSLLLLAIIACIAVIMVDGLPFLQSVGLCVVVGFLVVGLGIEVKRGIWGKTDG